MMASNDSTPKKNTNIADVTSNVNQNQHVHVHPQGQMEFLNDGRSRFEQLIKENTLISQLEKDLQKTNELSEQMRKEIEHLKKDSVNSKAREEQLLKENRLLEKKIDKLTKKKKVKEDLERENKALKDRYVKTGIEKKLEEMKAQICFLTEEKEKSSQEIQALSKQILEDQKVKQGKDTALVAKFWQVTDGPGSKFSPRGAQGDALPKLSGFAIASDRSFDLFRAFSDLKINLVDQDGRGNIFLKTYSLEEKVWNMKRKPCLWGSWCSFFDGMKTIILKERRSNSRLFVIDSETGNILENQSLNIDFFPKRMFVKNDTVFILGYKYGKSVVARLDLIKSHLMKKPVPSNQYLYYRSPQRLYVPALFSTDDCLYILFAKILFKCSANTLENMEKICEFTYELNSPNIFVQDHVMTVFSVEGNLTIDLNSVVISKKINKKKSGRFLFPSGHRVFSICEYQGGLALALNVLRDDTKIKVGWYKPSRNHEETLGSFRLITTLSLESRRCFSGLYRCGGISC